MKANKRPLIWTLALCAVGVIVTGLVWLQIQRTTGARSGYPLRVLCEETWLSEPTLQAFAKDHNTSVELYTYHSAQEFLRQMANADGKIDVICTSSWLLKSLVKSGWLKSLPYLELENAKGLAVDFVHLPFDPKSEYAVPIFWNLSGFFGKAKIQDPGKKEQIRHVDGGTKQILTIKKTAVWGNELTLLELLIQTGFHPKNREEREDLKGLREDLRAFLKPIDRIAPPEAKFASGQELLDKLEHAEWVYTNLSRVAGWLNGSSSNSDSGSGSDFLFLLPEDGGAMEIGLLAVGEKSQQYKLALQMVNELIRPEVGLDMNRRLGVGLVHGHLTNAGNVSDWLKPSALRRFPLNRLLFPDLECEVIPAFERTYQESFPPQHASADAAARSVPGSTSTSSSSASESSSGMSQ